MQINISGHHLDLTDALKSYVNEKMERLERHFDQIIGIDVTLSVEKERQKAEANVRIRGNDLHAEAEDNDMYAAIDLLVDKLDRQLVKRKEKTVDRNHGAS
ncbi:ribosome-associated translation inhibitor RaiA [Hahella sp. SMD15-11]|uniref:Ribosome hibernation promoting factor n=1 Tax=Thermohahella caldifontis TaxID=3142973 RepID=A0AB39UZK0_9GAMM